jgi:hypothetical protein
VSPLSDALAEANAILQPLFGVAEDRLKPEFLARSPAFTGEIEAPDLSVFYRVDVPEDRHGRIGGAFAPAAPH